MMLAAQSAKKGLRRPLHLRIAAELRQGILAGAVSAGEKLPTNRELTRKFGVSPVTVQNAMRSLAAEGLVISRGRAGTVVSDVVKETVGQIGIVMMMQPHRDDVVMWRYFESVVAACARHRFEAPVEFVPTGEDHALSLGRLLERWHGARGVLLLSPTLDMLEALESADLSRARLVLLNADSQARHVSWVRSDNFTTCSDIVTALYGKGHRHISFVGPEVHGASLQSSRERQRGFEAGGRDSGLSGLELAVTVPDRLDVLFEGPSAPTAIIVACGMETEKQILARLHEKGIAIPHDMSVICYDANDLTLSDGHRVAAVDQPLEQVAEEAVRHLAQWDTGTFQITLPQQLREGDTIAPPPRGRTNRRK